MTVAHVAGIPVEELLPLLPAAGALFAVGWLQVRSLARGRGRSGPGPGPPAR